MKIDNVKFFLLMKNYYVKTLDRKPHHLWYTQGLFDCEFKNKLMIS